MGCGCKKNKTQVPPPPSVELTNVTNQNQVNNQITLTEEQQNQVDQIIDKLKNQTDEKE